MVEATLLIDKTVKKIKLLYILTGINVNINKTLKDKYRSWATFTFNFLWFNTDAGGAILWFLQGVAQHKKFTELTFVAPCVTLCYLSNIKAFFMVINETTVDILLAKMREFAIQQTQREDDTETKRIIKEEDKYLNKVIGILTIFYVVLLISFALSPMLLILLNYYITNEVELLLPFLVVYPFDPFDLRFYPWVYLHQIWSEIVVVLGLFATDCMFYIFCTYLRIQFHLLSYYIKNLIPPESENAYDGEVLRLKLIELIKWHQQILSSVELLEKLYAKSTLFNFIASSVLICLTGFNVIAIDDIAIAISFLCFLLMSLLQIFFQCFFGNLLMESSIEVGDAIYNSRWYLTDLRLRKSMFLILTRSQTPSKLTAFKFADVNLKAFMKICSTAWSYFALLQTLYSEPPK